MSIVEEAKKKWSEDQEAPSGIIDAEFCPPSSGIETDNVFDPSLLDSAGYPLPVESLMDEEFFDNPMGPIMKMLGRYLDSIRPPTVMAYDPLRPPRSEHKVKIFRLNDQADLTQIESAIEEYLNNGYCCHTPAVVNDFLIMDFSRRKETEENEKI